MQYLVITLMEKNLKIAYICMCVCITDLFLNYSKSTIFQLRKACFSTSLPTLCLLFFFFLTLQYCIGFAVYQNEYATGIHMFPILNPPPSSLPVPSLLSRYIFVVLIYISLMTNEDHFFIYLLAIYVPSLEKSPFKFLDHFLNQINRFFCY